MLLIFISLFTFSFAFFKQEPNIIQYGNNLNLICLFEDEIKSQNINTDLIIWEKENININNINKTSKYKIFLIENAFVLKINNFTKEDLQHNYTCSIISKNFYTYKSPLNIKTFIKPLLKYNIKTIFKKKNYNNTNNKYGDIFFSITSIKKIFPVPKCMAEQSISMRKINTIYYNTILYINFIVNCKEKITIYCSILDDYYKIFTFENNDCIPINSKKESEITIFFSIIILCSFGISFTIFSVLLFEFFLYKKELKIKKNK